MMTFNSWEDFLPSLGWHIKQGEKPIYKMPNYEHVRRELKRSGVI